MSPSTLSLLLYIPFLIVGITTGVIFCIRGYKQGLWRALISLGISVVSVILSLLLGSLLGNILSHPVVGIVPESFYEDFGPMSNLASQFVRGLISDFLAVIFFAVLLLALLIVLKLVGERIKPEELQPESKGYRWGGVGVRVLDALLVSLLLLLPLYGSISTYISPVAKVRDVMGEGKSREQVYLNSISENGLVSLYKAGPAAWVQSGLSGFSVGDVDVDLADMAAMLEGAVVRFERVQNAETEEEIATAVGDLSDFLREELIEEDFFYQLVHQFRAEAVKEVDKMTDDDEEKEFAEFFLDVADVSRDEFEDNGEALLDFISYTVRPEIMGNLSEGNYSKLPAEFYDRFGSLLNHSEQAVAMKKFFLTTALAEELFLDLSDAMDWYSSSVDNYVSEMRKQAEKAAWDRAEQFVADRWPTKPLTEAERKKEAEAFTIIFFESNEANMLEAVARLPYGGAEDAAAILSEDYLLKELFYDEHIVSYIKANPDCLQPLKDRLKDCETTPLTDSSNLFDRYINLLAGKIVYPEGFDDAQWDEIITNEMGKNDSASTGTSAGSFGGGAIHMGNGAQSGNGSGTVTSMRFYVEGDESAPVDVILKSLTDQQHKQLIAQGFLELEDGRVLICEKVDYFYGVSSPEEGEIGRVEISPAG